MTISEQNSLSLGEFLRQEREKRGFTVEQVASATKIGVKILLQLESDQYHDLPAVPFIRGFVTSYARFIGLEPREVLTRYAQFIEQRSKERPNRESGHSGYAFEKREGDQTSRTILGVIMGGFLVVAAVGVVFLKPSRHHRSAQIDRLRAAHGEPSPSIAPSLVAASPEPKASASVAVGEKEKPESVVAAASPSTLPSPSPSPSATPAVAEGPDPLNKGDGLKAAQVKHKLVIRAEGDLWVRYRTDSRPSNQMILRKGRVLVVKGASQVVIQVSDPEHAKFSYNQSPFRVLEGDSKVIERHGDATLIFPAELSESIQEPFPGTSVLSGRAVPASPGQSSSITPDP